MPLGASFPDFASFRRSDLIVRRHDGTTGTPVFSSWNSSLLYLADDALMLPEKETKYSPA